jgi:hypothetical protein
LLVPSGYCRRILKRRQVPHQTQNGYDYEPDIEIVSIPATPEVQDSAWPLSIFR